jgi:nucleotide-binding universal stress UspA family protein
MPRPIIAAVDPRREDPAPAALGAELARLAGAPLVLAAAYPIDAAAHPIDAAADSTYPEYWESREAETERVLGRVRFAIERAAGPPLVIATMAVPAARSLARALHEVADREDAGMLVIGSSVRGRLGRVLPGAVTDRLLHGAPCPVTVAPAGFSPNDAAQSPRLVGIAFVETPDGYAALNAGRAIAEQAGALVRVLTVKEPLDLLAVGPPGTMATVDAERMRTEAAERVLAAGLDAVPGRRSAGGEVLAGPPADALAAASADLDLLVCGSRGHGPARTLALGGTSHALVRKATCPVMVVPAESATVRAVAL